MMNNIMLDIETLDNRPNAAIAQVAAVMFDPSTGELGAEFNQVVDIDDSLLYGTVNGDTIKWWMQQSDEARSIFKAESSTDLESTLHSFTEWVLENSDMKTKEGNPDALVWGNGATFDNVILGNAYEALGLVRPWSFWNNRDLRTVVDLGINLRGVDPKRNTEFDGVPHNALDDAKHQVKYLCSILKSLEGETIIE